jgi:hypothetical protein
MNYEAMPRIRLEVEQMKSAIIFHLGVHGSELGELLDKEITGAINSYPWGSEVTRIVHTALKDKIEWYFKYGKGAKAVEEAVEEGFKAATGLDPEEVL